MKLIHKYLILTKSALILFLLIFTINKYAIQYECKIKQNESLKKRNVELNKNDPFEFVLNPEKSICGADYGNALLFISIGPSKIENYKERLAIRSTWSNKLAYSHVQNLFMLGLSTNSSLNENIKVESEKYEDIIQANFIDSYANLTLKTLAIFKWASKYCYKAKFLLKSDDDIVINMHHLTAYFYNLTNNNTVYIKNTVFGSIIQPAVERNNQSKFYVSFDEFKPDYFDPYCIGSAYLLSLDLAKSMFELSFKKKHFKFEDVYVGMLAKYLNATFHDLTYNFVYGWERKDILDKFNYNAIYKTFFVKADNLEFYFIMWNMINMRIINLK